MRTYEVLFILSPQVPEEEATNLVAEFKKIGESTGAKLSHEEAWGRHRLAYPIQKSNEGVYHLFVYESDGPGRRVSVHGLLEPASELDHGVGVDVGLGQTRPGVLPSHAWNATPP